MGLGDVQVQLKSGIHGFGRAESGFPRLHQALRHALASTGYHVVSTADKKMAVVHNSHVDHADVLSDVIRVALESVEPQALGC